MDIKFMPIPEKVPLYHEKSLLDRVIDEVTAQDKPLGAADFNRVSVAAQIQEGIDRYRAKAANTSFETLFRRRPLLSSASLALASS